MERQPIITASELAEMNSNEILEGYRDGRAGEGEPGGNRSKAYWHGWRNGDLDRAGKSDDAQIALIRDIRRARINWADL